MATPVKPATLGEWKQMFGGAPVTRSVKDEMRDNLICKLETGAPLFPGVHGYDDTVVPQIVNAILSRHNFILLGLRGQAKSRILRGLTHLLDAEMPYIAGCEIHDNPLRSDLPRAAANCCREQRRRHADRLAAARGALRRKAGDARRDHRRHDRRHRSHQGGARRPRPFRAS